MDKRGRLKVSVLWAELKKNITLPIVPVLVVSTVTLNVIVTAVFLNRWALASNDILKIVPTYTSIGVIAISAVLTTHEYDGNQICTSLLAVPQRTFLITVKTIAILIISMTVSLAAMLASLTVLNSHSAETNSILPVVLGTIHLGVLSAITLGIGLMFRSMVTTLSTSLIILIVAYPVLRPIAELAEWLPSRLSSEIFITTELSSTIDNYIALFEWMACIMLTGGIRFVLSDG